jgi:uncharacterized protein YecE (DUF72 family)
VGETGRARVGCSGWQYRHWRGNFYPDDLPQKRWLEHYASVFDTVEINNSFYRLPEAATFADWASRAPARFLFAVKASRFLTHMKKLRDPEEPVERFFSRARRLGRHLGPVLYQLPPHFKQDPERLEAFLRILPRNIRHVLEVRDPSWYSEAIYALLERYRVALCIHDMPHSATGRLQIGPFVYIRFHGASGRYNGSYPDDRMEDWAAWIHERLSAGTDVYAYFNNDVGGHAPRNALTLRRSLKTFAWHQDGSEPAAPGASNPDRSGRAFKTPAFHPDRSDPVAPRSSGPGGSR